MYSLFRWIAPLLHNCSDVHSPICQIWELIVSQICHERLPMWFILRSVRTSKERESDICLTCTHRAKGPYISSFRESLASMLNISFPGIDSLAIRMQADKLFYDFSAALHFIDGCPGSGCHNQCQIRRAILWNLELQMWLINVLLDISCQYAQMCCSKL